MRSNSNHPHKATRRTPGNGFTLVELVFSLTILSIVVIVIVAVLSTAMRSKTSTANRVESAQAARVALDMLSYDLRQAGYGADQESGADPQPPIAYVDSLQVLIAADLTGGHTGTRDTVAYEPTGNPRPRPLDGTAWQPAMKYLTGAEIVRWTLDVNDDGAVDANDLADALSVEAQGTPNPNDYLLVRQVYGDSTNNTAGNNGGAAEKIALVRRPGGGVSPLFTVYLAGSSTPWDWSNGPVPADRLEDIDRIAVTITAPTPRADWRGQYPVTRLSTEINARRNVPNFGGQEFRVMGIVFDDADDDGNKDAGENGLAGATVRLGPTYATTTNSLGAFMLRAPAGIYTLRHTPPPGYVVQTSPDSFVVTLGPDATHNFADGLLPGGWVTAHAFEDADYDGVKDAGEAPLRNVTIVMSPSGQDELTDVNGNARLFASVGSYSVMAQAPDSFVVTTTNPVTGSMADGDSAYIPFGLINSPTGYIAGRVFRDVNRNRVYDTGDQGVENVYVSATSSDGLTVLGYDHTNNVGEYEIQVPANDPPGTSPYNVSVVVPAGLFPTTSSTHGSILVSAGETDGGHDFGFAPYQIITLTANRVLSLASRDLIEKDWNGNQTENARMDADLALGADAGATDNISVWFNDYNNTPLFSASPQYTRNAPASVLALALDGLDTGSPVERPDAVTGTQNAVLGNFFVWLNQNTNGNEGYLPATLTPVLKYRTADAGDVQAVVTHDCTGGSSPDIIVGTKSPTAGEGTVEVWRNGEGATPTFTREEIYPPEGSIPGNKMGEVTTMAIVDFNLDGTKDLVVGTRTDNYSGEILVFKGIGRTNGTRFKLSSREVLSDAAVTSITVQPMNAGDSYPDIVVGTQTGFNSGDLRLLQYDTSSVTNLNFNLTEKTDAPGVVTSLAKGDLGGYNGADIIMGWRQNATSYVGGVLTFYNDGSLPSSGSDPAGGTINNFVPALTVANFNYGVKPSIPPTPHLIDFAAGVKISSTTGALLVFIR